MEEGMPGILCEKDEKTVPAKGQHVLQIEWNSTMSDRGMELLAPAGNLQVFKSVINAGADAVYFGGPSFGARAYAGNLTLEESSQAIDYAHLHGKKAYLTVNTLLKNKEMDGLYDYLRAYYEMGLDAVLVQDLGVLSLIRSDFPDLAIHMSTQASVATAYGAGWLKKLGVERIVAARELSLKELKAMYDATGLEIEAFVHGALCVCYSGQCLMSSFLGGRSGNRGRCAQPCRLPYQIANIDQPGPYLLSPRDFCLIDAIPEMDEAGVYSYKIEGRMKSEEYAATVVSVYREAMDRYLMEGKEGYFVTRYEHELLMDAGSRNGFTDLYLRERNGRDLMSFTDSSHEAKLSDLSLPEEKKLPVEMKARIETGRPMSLALSRQGIQAEAESPDPVEPAKKAPLSEDKVRKQLEKFGGTPYILKKLDLCLSEDAFAPVSALNELRREAIEKLTRAILQKKGPDLEKRRADLEAGKTASDLLEGLSSNLVSHAGSHRTNDEGREEFPDGSIADDSEADALKDREIFVSLMKPDQLRPLAESTKDIRTDWNLILPVEFLIEKNRENSRKFMDAVRSLAENLKLNLISNQDPGQKLNPDLNQNQKQYSGNTGSIRLWLDLPEVLRLREAKLLDRSLPSIEDEMMAFFRTSEKSSVRPSAEAFEEVESGASIWIGYRCHSLDGLAYLLDHQISKDRILLSSRIYSWSNQTVETFRKMGFHWMEMPVELTAREMAHRDNRDTVLPVYGRQVLMIKADCTHKNLKGCDHKPEILYLKDRKKKEFPVCNRCSVCTNYIYNSLPTSLLADSENCRRLHPKGYEISLSLEDEAKVREIGRALSAFLEGKASELSFPTTRGHFRNGVL
jgi:putative protease